MESNKLVVKYFVEDPSRIHAEEFVPVLHGWIQQQSVPDHFLIDVADYAHVPGGPGTVLVAAEGHFYTDRGEDRLGLLYARRLPLPGSFTDRLRASFRAALEGCQRLENDAALSGRIKFRTDEAIFRITDRLAAPNTAETFASVKPELERFLKELYSGATVTLEHNTAAGSPFEARIKASPAPNLKALLTRLGSAAQVVA